jgi:hypothetical protein
MPPRKVVPLFIAAVLATLPSVAAGCGGGSDASQTDKDKAIAAARFLYAGQAKRPDLDRGPCLSESLPGLSDWVVDIAHAPRQAVDDRPDNQCQSYRDGQTHHFVELTPDGRLIRAQ